MGKANDDGIFADDLKPYTDLILELHRRGAFTEAQARDRLNAAWNAICAANYLRKGWLNPRQAAWLALDKRDRPKGEPYVEHETAILDANVKARGEASKAYAEQRAREDAELEAEERDRIAKGEKPFTWV